MRTPSESNFKPIKEYLDIDGTSTCFATKDNITIRTLVSRTNFSYVKTYLIKSDHVNKRHSILCLITDGTDRSVHADNGSEPLDFTVHKNTIIDGPLDINENDMLGIIVFNDRPNDFRLGYLEAIRNNYDSIFLFDADFPDVDADELKKVIDSFNKNKKITAPKEGQGGVIISGG